MTTPDPDRQPAPVAGLLRQASTRALTRREMLRRTGALGLALPAAALGTREHVERLHALLAPHAGANPVVDEGWAAFGPAARPIGLLAVAAGRLDEAGERFAHAVALAERWRAPAWTLRILGDWLRTGAPGRTEDELLGYALELARDLALPGLAARLAGATTAP